MSNVFLANQWNKLLKHLFKCIYLSGEIIYSKISYDFQWINIRTQNIYSLMWQLAPVSLTSYMRALIFFLFDFSISHACLCCKCVCLVSLGLFFSPLDSCNLHLHKQHQVWNITSRRDVPFPAVCVTEKDSGRIWQRTRVPLFTCLYFAPFSLVQGSPKL